MLKTERRMFIFSCDYGNITSLVITRLFSAFSCLTWNFKFRMQTAFQINILPFPIAYIRRYTEIGLHQKMFDLSSNMAATINL